MTKPKTYQQLKAVWDAKLKKSGFHDIEDSKGELKTWTFQEVNRRSHFRDSWEHYFYLATRFLHDHEFDTELDKVIWEYHSNNISVRDITKLLQKVKIRTNRQTVWQTIVRLRDLMKQRFKVTG